MNREPSVRVNLTSGTKRTLITFVGVWIVIGVVLMCVFRRYPIEGEREKLLASKSMGPHTVRIVESRSYSSFIDLDMARYRFELVDKRGLISATSFWGDSYTAQSSEVRWSDMTHCDCLLNGTVCGSLVGFDWQPTNHP